MIRSVLTGLSLLGLTILADGSLAAAPKDSPASACADAHPGCFAKSANGDWQVKPGLITTVVDKQSNAIYLVFPKPANKILGRFIYQTYLRQGLGSTPVGLDRSQSGPTQVIAFELHGSQVAVRVENTSFTAAAGPQLRAVQESFADSLVALINVTEVAADGSVLVNLQKWLGRDAFGVIDRLRESKQGDYRIDERLALLDTDSVQAFPDNLEIDLNQTFVSDRPGSEVTGIIPDAHALTMTLHHSLIRVPADGYEPLEADPRTGAISSTVWDYSAPLSHPVVKQLAHRFRLQKIDPSAARSKVVKPIIFYVDNAAPPEIQQALMEGAAWWSQAFDAAGFIDAFKVAPLPAGASVLDARYNVINWVHRQTRGWSYGENVIDPRTGEIIRGAVLLGSLRARQDRIIFEGLVGAAHTGTDDALDPLKAVAARLRQLATHETGHAIGLEHNFIASTYDDRASVMDYPPPRVLLRNGALDFSDAYKVGVGSWDKFAIHWLYGEPLPTENPAATRAQWIREAYAAGQRFVADGDARPVGSGIANGALWDDGADPITGLSQALAVRRFALNQFGAGNVRAGAPLSELRRVIVPVYLYHRYEVEAAAKWIGGAWVNYAVNGDGLATSIPVSSVDQQRALATILSALEPAELELSAAQIQLLSAGEGERSHIEESRELFVANTQPQFSLTAAVGAASDSVLRALWAPARLNRVAEQAQNLELKTLLDAPLDAILHHTSTSAHAQLIDETEMWHAVAELNARLNDAEVNPRVSAAIEQSLERLANRLKQPNHLSASFSRYIVNGLANPTNRNQRFSSDKSPHIPPGMPIGSADSGVDYLNWDFE
jgi:Met-zincin/Domain of unknown function (DUF5117)